MAQTKIPRIDKLFESAAAEPLNRENATDADAPAVGIVQELLTYHGYTGLPNISNKATYGEFGAKTEKHLGSVLKVMLWFFS